MAPPLAVVSHGLWQSSESWRQLLATLSLLCFSSLVGDTVCFPLFLCGHSVSSPSWRRHRGKRGGWVVVNVRDREAAWPPALNFCSRHPKLYGLVALVLLLLIAACVPIFTRTEPRPALTITTSPNLGTRENNADQVTPVSHIGCPNTTQQGSPVFAKLLAKNQASLCNTTLNWHSQDGAGSSYLSQGLRYEEDKKELVVDSPGLYYVFLELKLSPTFTNTGHKVQGWVSLVLQAKPQVDDFDNLALTVELFPCSMENKLVDRSWSQLLLLKAGHRLSVGLRAYLHGAQDAYRDWELSYPNTTSFGLFLVKPDNPWE